MTHDGSARGESILVIGGANVDRKLRSLATLALGTSNPMTASETFGGVARNVAESLARLGLPVELMTAVGDDVGGARLLDHASMAGVRVARSLRIDGAATGSYTAVLQPDGDLLLGLSDMKVLERLTGEALPAWPATSSTVVIDLNLPLPTVKALMERSGDAGVDDDSMLIAVAVSEPKMERLPARLDGLALLILNRGELSARVGRSLGSIDDVMAACVEVQQQGAREVIVTLGAEGVAMAGAKPRAGKGSNPAPRHLAAPPCSVVDVTGAGDAFAAGVIACLRARPGDLERACHVGQSLARRTLESNQAVAADVTPTLLARLVSGDLA